MHSPPLLPLYVLPCTSSDPAVADVYRRSSKPLPLFHEGEAPYRSRMRVHHHMEAMEDAQRTPHSDEDEGSSSGDEDDEEEDGSEEGEGEEEEEDGDSELGDGQEAAKEQRKQRSEAARERQRIQHKFDSSEDEENDDAEGEEEGQGEPGDDGRSAGGAAGPDMSTEAMADRARRAEREDAREEAAEAASALLKSSELDDEEKDPSSGRALDPTDVPLASPAAAAHAPVTTSSPAVAAKLAKLALHEDLLEAAIRPRPPHYGTRAATGSGAMSGYNSPAAHAFSPGYPKGGGGSEAAARPAAHAFKPGYPQGGGSEAERGAAAPRQSHGYYSPPPPLSEIQHRHTPVTSPGALGRREVTSSSAAEGSGSLTYRHTIGR